MSDEEQIRAALLDYLLMVRDFYDKINTQEVFDQLQTIVVPDLISQTTEPLAIRVARTEKDWIQRLLECLTTISRTFMNLERWRDWFLKLTRNLKLTDKDIEKIRKGPDAVVKQLEEHKFDEGYVRLVLKNATADFMDILSETREVLKQLFEHRPCIERLESRKLKALEEQLDRVKKLEYEEVLTQMQQTLAAVYNAPTYEDFLRNLADLLHMFGGWRMILQIQIPSLTDHKALRESFQESRKRVEEIRKLTDAFRNFVEARNLADYYVRQAEFSVIRMMLTYEGNTEEWWGYFIEIPLDKMLKLIPEQLDAHQLLIGVTHSLALLEDLDQRLLPQMPNIKTGIGNLGNFLESPTITRYSELVQNRLTLWDEYGPRWTKYLDRLRNELHELKK